MKIIRVNDIWFYYVLQKYCFVEKKSARYVHFVPAKADPKHASKMRGWLVHKIPQNSTAKI